MLCATAFWTWILAHIQEVRSQRGWSHWSRPLTAQDNELAVYCSTTWGHPHVHINPPLCCPLHWKQKKKKTNPCLLWNKKKNQKSKFTLSEILLLLCTYQLKDIQKLNMKLKKSVSPEFILWAFLNTRTACIILYQNCVFCGFYP